MTTENSIARSFLMVDDSGLKMFDHVLCSDFSTKDALDGGVAGILVGKSFKTGYYIIEDTEDGDYQGWKYAVPAPKEVLCFKSLNDTMSELVERGYAPNNNGDFIPPDDVAEYENFAYYSHFWKLCGTPVSEEDRKFRVWPEWIIEHKTI